MSPDQYLYIQEKQKILLLRTALVELTEHARTWISGCLMHLGEALWLDKPEEA